MDWYIRHFIVQKAIQYDKPGFVITKFKTPKGEVFQREVFFPESLIVQIENKIVQSYGTNAKKVLYDIGKTLGYNFALIFKAPSLGTNTEEDVQKSCEFIIKYNFSTWAKNVEIKEFDIKNKTMTVEADQHIVCRTNGLGHILTEGAEAGFASYLLKDPKMEVTQKKCQGRGDDKCIILWGTSDYFEAHKIPYISGDVIFTFKEDLRDRKFNDITHIESSKESMYSLIKKGTFQYKDGKVSYLGERYFDSGILTYYLIEYGLQKLEGSNNILYEIGYSFGKTIATSKSQEYVNNYLSALGWGDVLFGVTAGKESVVLDHFPWCALEEQIPSFNLIMGLISGLVSGIRNKELRFTRIEKITNAYQNKFSIRIY
jgi:predicted hydrocarbon binding protein